MLRKIIRLRKIFFTLTLFSILSIVILFTTDGIHSRFHFSPQQRKIQAILKPDYGVVEASVPSLDPELHEHIRNTSLIEDVASKLDRRITHAQNQSLLNNFSVDKPKEPPIQIPDEKPKVSLIQISDDKSKEPLIQVPDEKPKESLIQISGDKSKEPPIQVPNEKSKEPLIQIPDKKPKEPLIQNKKPKRKHIVNQADFSYLKTLRSKGQIESLPSGGERIWATPLATVRFPFLLKNIRPEEWENVYRVFLNLTFYPWWQKTECKNLPTTFSPPGCLNVMALASFPSSGNSWLRQLIEEATGIFTGSMYDDTSLVKYGMYGEGVIYDSGMTIVQKTHGYTTGDYMHVAHSERVSKNHMKELNSTGILIIRNPFKALISHRHLDVGGHTGFAPKWHFVGEGWREFVLLKIKLWEEFYTDWLENSRSQDLCVVLYEELVSNIIPVLERILKFLGLPAESHRLECISKYSRDSLKRKQRNTMSLDSNLFTKELQQEISKAIDNLNKILMDKMNIYLPLDNYEMPNNKFIN